MKRGYFGIGMFEPKITDNLGGLIRSAFCFDADFVFTIGNKYQKQPTDTADATKHMPCFHYKNFNDFLEHLPEGVSLVGIEIANRSEPLETFKHPERAIYLLGGENITLNQDILNKCVSVRNISTRYCLNVASCATVVLYDRHIKTIGVISGL